MTHADELDEMYQRVQAISKDMKAQQKRRVRGDPWYEATGMVGGLCTLLDNTAKAVRKALEVGP